MASSAGRAGLDGKKCDIKEGAATDARGLEASALAAGMVPGLQRGIKVVPKKQKQCLCVLLYIYSRNGNSGPLNTEAIAWTPSMGGKKDEFHWK